MDFILIAVLTLLNALFAMSEMALAASRKTRLIAMAEAGDKGASAAIELHDQPTQFLSTVQVGITSIGMLNGIVGEAAFSEGLAEWIAHLGMAPKPAAVLATTLVVLAITFITLIFGELVPKRIGQLYPESVARVMARPMRWLANAAGPFVRLLSACTMGVLKLLRVNVNNARAVTEEEITASLEEGVDAGLIEAHEHQMVRNVFHLDDRPLTSLMVPRSDIFWLDATKTVAQSLDSALASSHSWYPVCRGGLAEVVGVISLAQLLALRDQPGDALEQHAQSASFVPETLTGTDLLEQFRAASGGSARIRMLFVVDEYGVVQGLLTPLDLLEAITGELQPSATADAWAVQQADGSWLLEGQMPVAELKARLAIDELPLDGLGRYNTVAGLLMALTGRLPAVGERVEAAGWVFEVRALEGRRVDKLRASLSV